MKKSGRKHRSRKIFFSILAVLLIAYGCWTMQRPLPTLTPDATSRQLMAQTSGGSLAWPAGTQSAVGVVSTDIVETHGEQKKTPMASTAKILTALTVLKKKPLALGQQGPTIVLTDKDVALYNTYVAQDGSVVPVAAGEQLTEYQMLQAIMLPSANNIADSLAIWAYGSLPAYAAAANAYAAQLGLSSTHIGSDASGLAPDSVSTAHDLVTLGKVAMQHPVLAQIAAQSTVDGFPLVGTIKNVNFLLGNSGVVGIKTGNSDDVGGVFVSAARTTINDRPVTVVTALVGTDNLFSAVQGSLPLIKSAQTNFSASEAIGSGAVVGHYKQPWGGTINAVINHKFSITGWNGGRTSIAINLRPTIAPSADQGDIVGELVANQSAFAGKQTAPVTLSSAPSKAPILWRLTHPW